MEEKDNPCAKELPSSAFSDTGPSAICPGVFEEEIQLTIVPVLQREDQNLP